MNYKLAHSPSTPVFLQCGSLPTIFVGKHFRLMNEQQMPWDTHNRCVHHLKNLLFPLSLSTAFATFVISLLARPGQTHSASLHTQNDTDSAPIVSLILQLSCVVCVCVNCSCVERKGSSSNVFVWNSLAVHLAQHMGPTWLLKPPLSNTTIIFGVCSFCTNNAANFCENAFIIGSYISKPLQLMMFTACPRWIASSLSFADYSQFQRTYHGSRWLIERDYYYLDAFKAFEAFERLLGWVR